MTSLELRRGNFVDYEATTHVIERLAENEVVHRWLRCKACDDLYLTSIDSIKPIKLTAKIFLDFGFKKDQKVDQPGHRGSYYSISLNDCKYSFAYAVFREDWGFYHSYTDAPDEDDNNRFDFISCGVKYVHQLQNLFFALTGEELIYKHEKSWHISLKE